MTTQDVLVRGGLVADGGGGEPVEADVLIQDGRIAAVEPHGVIPADGRATLDATGRVVAPGFIDVHSHADNAPLLAEDDTSKILQGITTEVVGNCGFSLAPTGAESVEAMARFSQRIFPPLQFTWSNWAEFTELTDSRGYVTNYAPLIGHGTLRIAVLGMADVTPDAGELEQMGRLLEDALAGGAFGMSSGLVYPPAVFSETGELIALARHLGRDGLYTTHMRGEGDSLLSSIAETVRIGREGDCRVHISHLKWTGKDNWGKMPRALARIAEAADSGVSVTKDIYPYPAGSTMLTALLPPPFLADGDEGVLARLNSPEQLRRLASMMENGLPGWDSHQKAAGWDGVLVSTTASHRYEGKTIAELSQVLDLAPLDVLVRILREEELHASMVIFSMDEQDVRTAFADPDTMVGTDGLPPGSGGKPHPRLFGTFPRILGEYVRAGSVLPLGEAIRRMTSLPAKVFRIPGRGAIRPGLVADLVAFDPATVGHETDYRDPVRHPDGVSWVMQRGSVVVDGQNYLGPRSGRRLTPAA
ncbi:D-aminoacylase [Amycolatopsis acidiphila]|uniref:D-aminoacylase n=1 Tax=Amycolatopsis acidiphila TaxID=715473 RepID=A0A558A8D1_9PSEU|nr:D-aminoacylase [Amycolatopsis acidiphila]TVT20522.1 D-aminoacylase [Amycolatopsis acidiphila]UIJ57052.1 D-aminoacylase [Amycolatopsis acidiphila]GHG53635.1 aminoacylase [Amycolatopsis acidiphila]